LYINHLFKYTLQEFLLLFPRQNSLHLLQTAHRDFPENVTPHTLRHTFATRCFEAGIPLEVISKELGHSDVSVTARTYVHLLPDFQTKEMLKLEKEVG